MAHCDAGRLSYRQRKKISKGLSSCRTRAEEQKEADIFVLILCAIALVGFVADWWLGK
jgi:hypothetical protein